MKWIYWAFLLVFFAILKIAEERYFILIFFAPFQDLVWLGYPLFATITLASEYIRRYSRFGEVLIKILALILGLTIIVWLNFSILPVIVIVTLGYSSYLL